MTGHENKSSNSGLVVSGELLVADFQSALVNMATADTAQFEAKRSEQIAVQAIADSPHDSNPIFITPRDIPAETQAAVAQASVDAHLKKVQAEQIASFSAAQIAQMEQEDEVKYKGKKVTIDIIDGSSQPVESIWFDNKTGQYQQTIYKKSSCKGTIQEISLTRNVLVLKPSFVSSLILPARKLFAVYVINPQTLSPAVRLHLG